MTGLFGLPQQQGANGLLEVHVLAGTHPLQQVFGPTHQRRLMKGKPACQQGIDG